MDESRASAAPPSSSLAPYLWVTFFVVLGTIATAVILASSVGSPYAREAWYAIGGVVVVEALCLPLLLRRSLAGGVPHVAASTPSVVSPSGRVSGFELALQGSDAGFWEYDLVHNTILFSGRLMGLLGYPANDYRGDLSFWHGIIHPDDVEGVKRTLAYHLEGRTPRYHVSYRVRRHNGEELFVDDEGMAERDASGKPVRAAGVIKDVTNEHRVQDVLESRTAELEEARVQIEAEVQNVRKFQKAVDATQEAVVITTPDGLIVYVNAAWCLLNGYTEAEVVGKNPRILKSGETPPATYEEMWRLLGSGATFHTEEVVNRKKDGTTYQAEVSIFPIGDGAQAFFYVGICRDITLRKQIDRAKTEFVSLASHQLRTPLSAIRWYSEMLLSGYAGVLEEKQKSYVREIYQGNLRMVELVNALLNTSRIDLGTFVVEPVPCSPVEICESVLSELAPQVAEKEQVIDRNFAGAPTSYSADPKLLRIIFQNLLSNAVKYTAAHGKIAVEVGVHGTIFSIRVTDTGYGIPVADQPHIFEKLFRADNVRRLETEGTGLGMYIVRSIVKACDGDIRFTSEEGKGTTFFVDLPLAGMPKRDGAKGLS